MSTPFENFLKCSIGGADFQCTDRSISESAIYAANGFRQGTKIEIELEGEIAGDSAADLETKIAAAVATFRQSGNDFILYGIGGVIERSIPAAICINGGPNIDRFNIKKQKDGIALVREFEVTIVAQTAQDNTNNPAPEQSSLKEKISYGADGLRVYTLSGEILGNNARAAARTIVDQYIASFEGDNWVAAPIDIETNSTDDKATYSVTVTELRQPLPGGDVVVDGSGTFSQSRDEQMRMTKVFAFDLLVMSGSYNNVIDELRRQVPETFFIIREQYDVELYRNLRVRASFEVLEGGNGNELMNWTTSFRFTSDDATYEPRANPGGAPLLVKRPKAAAILIQSGEAVCAGGFLRPPAPLFPDRLIEQPTRDAVYVNEVEKKITWSYTMTPPPPRSGGDEWGGVRAEHFRRPTPIITTGPTIGS